MSQPGWEWEPDHDAAKILARAGASEVEVLHCRVNDGTLRAIRDRDAEGLWHLSISHRPKRERRQPRWPTWDELVHARDELLPSNIVVGVLVTLEDETLHMHELRASPSSDEQRPPLDQGQPSAASPPAPPRTDEPAPQPGSDLPPSP